MRSFDAAKPFKDLLLADADVRGVLSAADIEQAFDLDRQLRHVNTIFARVFEEASV
jgi:adenylosuccinate lyase